MEPKFELESDDKLEQFSRELKIIINIIEPDPEYQPYILTNKAKLFDISAHSQEIIAHRLNSYFGQDLEIDFSSYLWEFIIKLKSSFKEWPDKDISEYQ